MSNPFACERESDAVAAVAADDPRIPPVLDSPMIYGSPEHIEALTRRLEIGRQYYRDHRAEISKLELENHELRTLIDQLMTDKAKAEGALMAAEEIVAKQAKAIVGKVEAWNQGRSIGFDDGYRAATKELAGVIADLNAQIQADGAEAFSAVPLSSEPIVAADRLAARSRRAHRAFILQAVVARLEGITPKPRTWQSAKEPEPAVCTKVRQVFGPVMERRDGGWHLINCPPACPTTGDAWEKMLFPLTEVIG